MAATSALSSDPLPMKQDLDGVLRVGGTRVTLDVVVEAFDEGATPEEIVQQYPTLHLVYVVVAYMLRHRPEVDTYLQGRRTQAATLRRAGGLLMGITGGFLDARTVRDRYRPHCFH